MRSDGQVMNLNFCQVVAPSTDAASYISFGIASGFLLAFVITLWSLIRRKKRRS